MSNTISKNLYSKNLSMISLALMMLLLHSALWFDFGSYLSKSLFLAHFGFFLLWQPIWNHYKRLTFLNSTIFITLTLLFVYWLNLWLILGWLFLIVGFIGGMLKYEKSERYIYMISLLFFITELLIGCNTQLFNIPLDNTVDRVFTYGMFYIPLLIFIFPKSTQDETVSVDFLRAVSSSLLISLLTLGSLLNMYHSGSEYLLALIQTILAIAFSLLVISWLLSPKIGFSGLSQLWSQSLLNIGTPFETWLNRLYIINQEIDSPEEFLESAMRELVSISWISGIEWHNNSSKGKYALTDKYEIKVNIKDLDVTIHSHLPSGGALYLHARLLIQLIENMYTAKVHEYKLAQQTHLKTVYETGARITHDIKNLLQSLKTLSNIVLQPGLEKDDANKLFETQLPNLTLRLQLALDKLQSPETVIQEHASLEEWVETVQNRLGRKDVSLEVNIKGDTEIPQDLFDSVLDNLLENSYIKQQMNDKTKIIVSIIHNEKETSLSVCDTGEAIPATVSKKLFKEIIPSQNGLGIGLYQAAKQAKVNGYGLKLLENRDGEIRFKLEKS